MIIDDLPVLLTRPDFSTPPRAVGNRTTEVIEAGGAGPKLAIYPGRNQTRAFSLNFKFKNRDDTITFEDFLFDLKGAKGSFWLPGWHAELAPTGSIVIGETVLSIHAVGYNATYLVDTYARAVGRWIYLLANDGTLHVSEVTAAIDGADEDTLTLATAPTADFTLGQFHVGFLYCVRQIGDHNATDWDGDEAQIPISVTTKIETEPSADAGMPAPIVELQAAYQCGVSYKIEWIDFNDGATYEILYSDTGSAPWTSMVTGLTVFEYELPTPTLRDRSYILRASVLDSTSGDSNIVTLQAITVEAMMRTVQERLRVSQGAPAAAADVTGSWALWPNRHSPDTTNPGHYPEEDFYAADIADPVNGVTYSVALVTAIAQVMEGFSGSWKTTGDWNGLVTIPDHDATSLGIPVSSGIDASNYKVALLELVDSVCLMKWLAVQADQTDIAIKSLFVYKTAGGPLDAPLNFKSAREAADCANDHKDTVDWADLVWLGDWNHSFGFSSGNLCGEKYRAGTTSSGPISVDAHLQWVFMTTVGPSSVYAWEAALGNIRGKLSVDLTNYGPDGGLTMFYFPASNDAEANGVIYPKDQWNDATPDIGPGITFSNWTSLGFVLNSSAQRVCPLVAGGGAWILADQLVRVYKSPLREDAHWSYYPTDA